MSAWICRKENFLCLCALGSACLSMRCVSASVKRYVMASTVKKNNIIIHAHSEPRLDSRQRPHPYRPGHTGQNETKIYSNTLYLIIMRIFFPMSLCVCVCVSPCVLSLARSIYAQRHTKRHKPVQMRPEHWQSVPSRAVMQTWSNSEPNEQKHWKGKLNEPIFSFSLSCFS